MKLLKKVSICLLICFIFGFGFMAVGCGVGAGDSNATEIESSNGAGDSNATETENGIDFSVVISAVEDELINNGFEHAYEIDTQAAVVYIRILEPADGDFEIVEIIVSDLITIPEGFNVVASFVDEIIIITITKL